MPEVTALATKAPVELKSKSHPLDVTVEQEPKPPVKAPLLLRNPMAWWTPLQIRWSQWGDPREGKCTRRHTELQFKMTFQIKIPKHVL